MLYEQIRIGGVDYSGFLKKNTASVGLSGSKNPGRLSFTLNPNTPKPSTGSEVYYFDQDGDAIFGGIVWGFPENHLTVKTTELVVSCLDWRHVADMELINDKFIGLTAGEILVKVAASKAPWLDVSQVDLSGQVIPSLVIPFSAYFTDLLDLLVTYTGYIWDITPHKELIWAPPENMVSPVALTDSSKNFSNLSVDVSLENFRNRVIVKGGDGQASQKINQRWVGDGFTTYRPLPKKPYVSNQYNFFVGDFNNGIDPGVWIETDANNPAPTPGHTPSDGYLHTTYQPPGGSGLVESGWCQIDGGTGTWGQVRLMSFATFERKDRRRIEAEISCTSAGGLGIFGLWDPLNQAVSAGVRYGILFDGASGLVRPMINGVTAGASNAVTWGVDTNLRARIFLGASAGATILLNKNAVSGYPASDWVPLALTAAGTATDFVISPIFNRDFVGRVKRVRVFDRPFGATYTEDGVEKTLGLSSDDDNDDQSLDALLGAGGERGNYLATFSAAATGVVCVLDYTPAIQIRVVSEDPESIAAMKAIQNPTNSPTGPQGAYEYLIDDPQIDSYQLALLKGSQDNQNFANPNMTISFTTYAKGCKPGQILSVNLSKAGGSDRDLVQQFLITAVTATPYAAARKHRYAVTGTSRLKGLESLLFELLARGSSLNQDTDQNQALDRVLAWYSKVNFGETISMSLTPDLVALDGFGFAESFTLDLGPAVTATFVYGSATYGGTILL